MTLMTAPWLTMLGVLPIVGSLIVFFLKGKLGKTVGLVFSLLTLGLAGAVMALAKIGPSLQFVEVYPWIKAFGAYYALGLDGMGLMMVLLTAILVPIVLIAEWSSAETVGRWGGNIFFALVLLLEGLSLYVFMATDVLLFYIFFEATLIPMYFLIGGFGGKKARSAAIKFLLFSLAGGLIMLVSVVGLYVVSGKTGMPTYLLTELMSKDLGGSTGKWLMAGFLIAFIIKAPMVPLHTWLPDTAEEATPGSSTLLVGILDKIGTFGMIRFCIELFPEASKWATPLMITLAIISILYGAIAAVGQKNLLRFVAFTSISHFGFMVLGIYTMTTQGMTGSIFYMLNHGFSTAALFLVVGFMVKRRGSAEINAFGGVQKLAPVLAGVLLLAGLSTVSLPGMSSFVSEFLVLAGAWGRNPGVTAVATLGMVLAAVYMLTVYQRTMTGPVTAEVAQSFGPDATTNKSRDLTMCERLIMVPLILIILVLGFFPKPALQAIEPTASTAMTELGMQDPQPKAGKVGN